MTQTVSNGYKEAVAWINGQIYENYIDPIFHVAGTSFEQHFNEQANKRNQIGLSNEEIKARLDALNAQERDRQMQEQEIEAGTRKRNLVASKLYKAQAHLEKELGASLFYHAGKQRFEVVW